MTALSDDASSLTSTIPQMKIQPPTTTHDDASPSHSCLNDMERVFRLIEDERHLSARALYHSVQKRLVQLNELSSPISSSASRRLNLRSRFQKAKENNQGDFDAARRLLKKNQEALNKLEVSGSGNTATP
jgi:hypothetical protein